MARKRSAQAHRKVLEAALGLFAECGIDATSMDAIAEASGVSKATIYKHWPDKDTLCLEVLSHLHGLDEEPPSFDAGDLRADLIAQLSYQPAQDRKEMKDRIMPHLMAYGARHRVFGERWRARAIERPVNLVKQILRRAKARGELSENLDLEIGAALLMGPMIYRHIFGSSLSSKLPADFVDYVVDTFRAGNAGKVPRRSQSKSKRSKMR
jgi:AcrR family transcriptional regulator